MMVKSTSGKTIKKKRINPFFIPYGTPHDTVPFDKIRISDYEEAFMEGIRREKEQIQETINNKEKPTFKNTLIETDPEKEFYYDLLSRVSSVFFNLLSAETNDKMDALAQKIQPILTKHSNDISLNKDLFKRVQYVKRHHGILSMEEKQLLTNSYEGFVRSGALLSDEDKEKLRKLSEEANMLSLMFSQNLLKENKDFSLHLINEEQLDGLPETAREAARKTAEERKKKGWIFTLDQPSYGPFMTYSTQRELRKKMYYAKNTVCIHENEANNEAICQRIINIRREIAQMLGYKTFAEYVLKNRMAKNVATVDKFLNDIIESYRYPAEKEVLEVEKIAKRLEGKHFILKPWDFSYYSHKLQMKKFNIDSEMLRPYFELSKVIKGVFGLATRLYGITFKENKDIPVYHRDVKAYEVFDHDGSYLAVLYADFFPRKGKQGGAWMTEYQGQWIDEKGNNIRPHVSVVTNFTKPTKNKPALLTLGEVETFLHEFGHSLHGIFANTRFESMSGTNVKWDFVELPSQIMENYAIEKEFLKTFAFHYKTGEVLPDELIDRIVKSRNFMVAYGCMRQVSFALLDMAYYTQTKEFTQHVKEFEKKAWEKAIILEQLPDTCMTVQFSHIMAGGYAAGYYSYKWAEVLDADAFSVFKRKGIFNRNVADKFRECILSKGGTQDPMALFRTFRGAEPNIKALLKRNGIDPNIAKKRMKKDMKKVDEILGTKQKHNPKHFKTT